MKQLSLAVVLLVVQVLPTATIAYEPPTHRDVALRAAGADNSSIDLVLRTELGFPTGVTTKFSRSGEGTTTTTQQADEWIGSGAFTEDSPRFRVINHFHNPLLPWDAAGLEGVVPPIGYRPRSSVRWQQDDAQHAHLLGLFGPTWSWQRTRRDFVAALTSATKDERDTAFADLFRGLGQLSHLVQDATVPGHARNDPHAFHEGYERWVDAARLGRGGPNNADGARRRQVFEDALTQSERKPSLSLLAPTNDDGARVPIARLIDADVFDGLNTNVLTGLVQGAAEYSNGNFVSEDTIFLDFALPRRAALAAVPVSVPENGGVRRYYAKVADGEPVARFVAEGTFTERLLRRGSLLRGEVLTDGAHEDYAKLLLPRAVGYSAALFDYFFRGRLNAAVQSAAVDDDPLLLELRAFNGSAESLTEGSVAIYAESDGERRRVLDPASTADAGVPLPDISVGDAATNQPVLRRDDGQRIRFRSPFPGGTDRYVVVYKGGLGDERADAASGFPGAVIGKVTGGARAESIYADSGRSMLRTADGVFPAGPAADGLDMLRWGDVDNTFIGLVTSAPAVPQAVKAFRIDREAGSSSVPLTETAGEERTVSITELARADFPFGLALGVTVQFTHRVAFAQKLEVFDRIDELEERGDLYPDGRPIYTLKSHRISPMRYDEVVNRPVDFAEAFPIVLDRAHLDDGSFPLPRPYAWKLADIALDAQGRLLALVHVKLTVPVQDTQPVQLLRRNREGVLEPFTTSNVRADFPVGDVAWALIDLGAGRVLGKTSAPAIVLSSEAEATIPFPQQRHTRRIFANGPLKGQDEDFWEQTSFLQIPPPTGDVEYVPDMTGELDATGRDKPIVAVTGLLRDDLERLTSSYLHHEELPLEDIIRTYELDGYTTGLYEMGAFVMHVAEPIPFRARQVQFVGTIVRDLLYRGYPREVKLVRPGTFETGPEAVVLFGRPIGISLGEQATLVRWSPESSGRTELAYPEKLLPATWRLISASPGAAMLHQIDPFFGDTTTWVVTFAAQEIFTFFGQDLSQDYVLLAPDFLYNVADTRFHLLDDALPATALPVALAPADPRPEPLAAYHLIRLP